MKVQTAAVRLREREVSSVKANSTSTMFVTSTISVPDLDEIILSVSSVLQCQMFRCVTGMHDKHYGPTYDSLEEAENAEGSITKEQYETIVFRKAFSAFDELRYIDEGNGATTTPLNDLPDPPKIEDIYDFITNVFETAQFSPECNVIALVYTNRLLAFIDMPLHRNNWRLLFLSSLLLAQKVWDDKSLGNVDFPLIWRAAVKGKRADFLNLKKVNALERKLLELLQYNVTVNSSLYAKYYFELRALCEANYKRQFSLSPLSAVRAARLEARSTTSENSFREKWSTCENGKLGRSKSGSRDDMSSLNTSKARAVIS